MHTRRKTYKVFKTERYTFKNVIALNLFMFMLNISDMELRMQRGKFDRADDLFAAPHFCVRVALGGDRPMGSRLRLTGINFLFLQTFTKSTMQLTFDNLFCRMHLRLTVLLHFCLSRSFKI